MEHRLISGGGQWLPFARSCIAKLKRLGLPYAAQSFEIDGASIRVRIEPGHEYIEISGSPMPLGWKLTPTSESAEYGYVTDPATPADGGKPKQIPLTLDVLQSEPAEGENGRKTRNPDVFLSAKSNTGGLQEETLVHSGSYLWTRKQERLLINASLGGELIYRQCSITVWDGEDAETPGRRLRLHSGGIAETEDPDTRRKVKWLILATYSAQRNQTDFYALSLKKVQAKALSSAVGGECDIYGAMLLGAACEVSPAMHYAAQPAMLWKFSPDGLKAISLEAGLVTGTPDVPAHDEFCGYVEGAMNSLTGVQYIHRAVFTPMGGGEDSPPFSVSCTRERRENALLKCVPRSTFTVLEMRRDFQRFPVTCSRVLYNYEMGTDESETPVDLNAIVPVRPGTLPPGFAPSGDAPRELSDFLWLYEDEIRIGLSMGALWTPMSAPEIGGVKPFVSGGHARQYSRWDDSKTPPRTMYSAHVRLDTVYVDGVLAADSTPAVPVYTTPAYDMPVALMFEAQLGPYIDPDLTEFMDGFRDLATKMNDFVAAYPHSNWGKLITDEDMTAALYRIRNSYGGFYFGMTWGWNMLTLYAKDKPPGYLNDLRVTFATPVTNKITNRWARSTEFHYEGRRVVAVGYTAEGDESLLELQGNADDKVTYTTTQGMNSTARDVDHERLTYEYVASGKCGYSLLLNGTEIAKHEVSVTASRTEHLGVRVTPEGIDPAGPEAIPTLLESLTEHSFIIGGYDLRCGLVLLLESDRTYSASSDEEVGLPPPEWSLTTTEELFMVSGKGKTKIGDHMARPEGLAATDGVVVSAPGDLDKLLGLEFNDFMTRVVTGAARGVYAEEPTPLRGDDGVEVAFLKEDFEQHGYTAGVVTESGRMKFQAFLPPEVQDLTPGGTHGYYAGNFVNDTSCGWYRASDEVEGTGTMPPASRGAFAKAWLFREVANVSPGPSAQYGRFGTNKVQTYVLELYAISAEKWLVVRRPTEATYLPEGLEWKSFGTQGWFHLSDKQDAPERLIDLIEYVDEETAGFGNIALVA